MQKILSFILMTSGMLFPLLLSAEVLTIPRNANIRSSRYFYGQDNVIDQLPEGAQVDVVERKSLPTGADSLKIKIISPPSLTSLNEKKDLYIWQSKTEVQNKSFTEAGTSCPGGTCDKNNDNVANPVTPLKNIAVKMEENASTASVVTSSTDDTDVQADYDPNAPAPGDSPAANNNDQTTSSTTASPAPASGSLAKEIDKYVNSPQVKRTIQWAKDHRRRGDGNCYQHTKEALAAQSKGGKGAGNNLIPAWFASQKAKYGVKDLKDRGFINLLDYPEYKNLTPATAPQGTALIYKHVKANGTEDRKAGHAEIPFDEIVNGQKVRKYFYGPIHDYPVNRKDGSRYILIGVMLKSPLEGAE